MALLTRRQLIGKTTALGRRDGPVVPIAGLAINPRQSWAVDRPPLGPPESEDVRFLIVHHSASGNGHRSVDAPRIIRSYYDYHTSDEKGWADIAYNFLIDAEGGVWEGRAGSLDGPVRGDATGGNQGFTQLVCLIGDYDTSEPTGESLSSLVTLLAWLADRYEISTSSGAAVVFTSRGSNRHPEGTRVTTPTITGHRTMSRTTCPGDNLNSYVLGDLTADVEAERRMRSTSTTVASTSTTVASAATDSTSTAGTTPPGSSTSVPAPPPVGQGAGDGGSFSSLPIVSATGAVTLAASGVLLWRRRRMREDGTAR